MFRKLLIALAFIGILSGCSSNHDKSAGSLGGVKSVSSQPTIESGVNGKTNASQTTIGGWVPLFMVSFDQSQLDGVAEGLNQGRIKRAIIVYPTKMQTLASKIHDYLQQKTPQNISMRSVELRDTEQVKYDLTQVIITLYY
jgi:hypothetical protein